jgi:hypothetical protein
MLMTILMHYIHIIMHYKVLQSIEWGNNQSSLYLMYISRSYTLNMTVVPIFFTTVIMCGCGSISGGGMADRGSQRGCYSSFISVK